MRYKKRSASIVSEALIVSETVFPSEWAEIHNQYDAASEEMKRLKRYLVLRGVPVSEKRKVF